MGQRECARDQLGGLRVGHRRAALVEQELDRVAGGALLRNRARDRPDADVGGAQRHEVGGVQRERKLAAQQLDGAAIAERAVALEHVQLE